METIGDRVAARMKLLGFDQKSLAGRCGTKQANISRLTTNKTDSPEYLYELSLALETSVKWLKTGIEDKPIEFMLKYKSLIDAYEAADDNIKQSIRLQLGLNTNKKISPENGVPDSNTSPSHGKRHT